jgi:peptidoglycan hydrolase-like protein with peptidoglycan-binding domain
MKLSRNGKIALYSLPILLGGYLIYRQFAKSKAAKSEPPKNLPPQHQTPTKPTQPTANDSFPLKKGSRDAGAPYAPSGRVVALQQMINIQGYNQDGVTTQLKEDGIFGTKTETAVMDWLGKNSVDNLDDWNEIFRGVAPYIAAPLQDPMAMPDYNDYKIKSF